MTSRYKRINEGDSCANNKTQKCIHNITWLILRFKKLSLNSGGIGHRGRPTRGSSHSFRLGGEFCFNNYLLEGVGFYRKGVFKCCIGRILSHNREVLLASFKPIVIRELILIDPRRTQKWHQEEAIESPTWIM